jgi:hypothetical protein
MSMSLSPDQEAQPTFLTRGEWEAKQAIPLLITLVIAGACAVGSQLPIGHAWVSPLCVGGFGLCVLSIVTRFRKQP